MNVGLAGATIRAARRDECVAIVALIHECFGEYRGKIVPESSALADTAAKIEAFFPDEHVAVAEQDGRLIGCITAVRKPGHVYLGRLAVLKPHRRAGIAASLIGSVEDFARRHGVSEIRLEVRIVFTGNQRLFQALGFREIAKHAHPGFDHPTYLEMAKTLG
jgi:N-acetylglutamate synthase-like GNAT family acetyltransferase